ncbi:hypothetical protein AYI70_g5137 [Smittium culicis]|uniref:Uncharacterized protein n=1 Tax=Smittium culicis TaxID=133412 RepID=A0A1R1XVV9_9FUNG|nr:hypothetical protein AYI70_g5137 [Smittium culicis]
MQDSYHKTRELTSDAEAESRSSSTNKARIYSATRIGLGSGRIGIGGSSGSGSGSGKIRKVSANSDTNGLSHRMTLKTTPTPSSRVDTKLDDSKRHQAPLSSGRVVLSRYMNPLRRGGSSGFSAADSDSDAGLGSGGRASRLRGRTSATRLNTDSRNRPEISGSRNSVEGSRIKEASIRSPSDRDFEDRLERRASENEVKSKLSSDNQRAGTLNSNQNRLRSGNRIGSLGITSSSRENTSNRVPVVRNVSTSKTSSNVERNMRTLSVSSPSEIRQQQKYQLGQIQNQDTSRAKQQNIQKPSQIQRNEQDVEEKNHQDLQSGNKCDVNKQMEFLIWQIVNINSAVEFQSEIKKLELKLQAGSEQVVTESRNLNLDKLKLDTLVKIRAASEFVFAYKDILKDSLRSIERVKSSYEKLGNMLQTSQNILPIENIFVSDQGTLN